jgi:Ca2+-binding RTX toxin-like protein
LFGDHRISPVAVPVVRKGAKHFAAGWLREPSDHGEISLTSHFITTSIFNTATDGIDLSTGDTLFVASGITVAGGTNGSGESGAVSSGGGISAQILGTLWGSNLGLDFYGTSGGDTVFVGAGASVIGVTGGGIDLSGNNDVVTNNGEITGTTLLSEVANAGITLNGSSGTITNTGSISGNYGIFLEGGQNVVNNSGTIDGTNYGIIAITPGAGLTDTIDNSGTIRSGSNGAAISAANEGTGSLYISNSGHIVGEVGLGDGNDVYDGTLGSVTGSVFGEGGNDELLGGAGSDFLDGGTGSDVVNGGGGNDTLLAEGTQAIIDGGDGNDEIAMQSFLNASDQIDGGAGKDILILNGDYSAGLVMGADTVTNVEKMVLEPGFSYTLTMDDNNVAAGQQMTVDASKLTSSNTLKFDGSAETDGRYVVDGGAGNDYITGSAGNDILTGGGGDNRFTGGAGEDKIIATGDSHDRFIYTDVSDSTSTTHDVITGFSATADAFDLDVTVTGISAEVTSGRLSTASFDANLATAISSAHLAAGHAVLFTPTTGNLAGHTFLIVDANGTAGYQAGQDYVFDVTGAAHLTSLSTSDFI